FVAGLLRELLALHGIPLVEFRVLIPVRPQHELLLLGERGIRCRARDEHGHDENAEHRSCLHDLPPLSHGAWFRPKLCNPSRSPRRERKIATAPRTVPRSACPNQMSGLTKSPTRSPLAPSAAAPHSTAARAALRRSDNRS